MRKGKKRFNPNYEAQQGTTTHTTFIGGPTFPDYTFPDMQLVDLGSVWGWLGVDVGVNLGSISTWGRFGIGLGSVWDWCGVGWVWFGVGLDPFGSN